MKDMKEAGSNWVLAVVVGAAVAVSGISWVASVPAAEGEKKPQSSEGQRAGFDIFLMGVVSKTNYDVTPPTITMKVIEGALERLGQEVELIIETEEAIKHFKRRVRVGVELDTRVRVGTDGKLYMATSQRRPIPSREFKGGPTIEESIKKFRESGG
jgi:hypothetical protein